MTNFLTENDLVISCITGRPVWGKRMMPAGAEELADTGTSVGAQRPAGAEGVEGLVDVEGVIVICYKHQY